ncbi:hypothetical protein ACIHDR_48585 [Nocardia sp. NPDC052278]|uniref:hypothetical protein n=1 Tax=unclassified Nocardia TaxID=2637762 RepID=UPI003697B1B5
MPQLTEAIGIIFDASGKTYSSTRIGDELRENGWRLSDNTSRRSCPKAVGLQGKSNVDTA